MDLQRAWQQQAAPAAAPAAAGDLDANLLAETQRLHRYGQQRNRLSAALMGLSLLLFFASQFLTWGEPHKATEHWGLVLLNVVILGFVAVVWRGTRLRGTAGPGLDSRAYVRASLRAFRFRQFVLRWLAVPYAFLLGVGLALVQWDRLHVETDADWWKPAFLVGLCVGAVLVGRRLGLRKYEAQFGPTVRELEHWETAWEESPKPGPATLS